MKIKLLKLKCQRCPHEWYPRAPRLPKVCPKCKSPVWDKPRKKKKIQEDRRVSNANTFEEYSGPDRRKPYKASLNDTKPIEGDS